MQLLGKSMKSVRENRNIKLVATERRRKYLVFHRNLLAIEMKKLKY